jgi:hypothetical protein
MKDLIEAALNTKVDYSDREGCEKKLNDCINAVGMCAKYQSICKGDLERAKALTLRKYPDLNSRMLKFKLDASTIDEQQNLEYAEKLWQGLHKTIDGLKSLMNVREKELDWH